MFIISQLLCVRNLGVATLLFWLGVFHEVVVKRSARAVVT